MISRVAILSAVALLIAVFQPVQASCAPQIQIQVQRHVVLKISDLRSACLIRAGVVHYDESNTTSDHLRQQLQRHFDVVLALLRLNTSRSIQIALDRLQAADHHSWTPEERNAWHEKLLAARLLQLQRLAAYSDRGLFPQNQGQSPHPVPIFVDRHNTACAVGHLMRCSGWSNVVDAIQKSNNLIYVPDAAHSPIASWVLTSGLTLEEAALIQPGYYWEGGQFDASAYGPGESAIENNGLRYSNFQLQAQNYTVIAPGRILPVSGGATPTLTGLGLLTGQGGYVDSSQPWLEYTPQGTNWISIGVNNSQPALHSLGGWADSGNVQLVTLTFDVATIDANQLINGISETSEGYFWGGFQGQHDQYPPASGTYFLHTTAYDSTTELASLNVSQSTAAATGIGSATQSFADDNQISVQAVFRLQDGVALNTFILDFNVVTVPEPTTELLLLILMTACALSPNRAKPRLLSP